MCPIWLRDKETIEHILWECPSAVDVWGCGPASLQKCPIKGVVFLKLHYLQMSEAGAQGERWSYLQSRQEGCGYTEMMLFMAVL